MGDYLKQGEVMNLKLLLMEKKLSQIQLCKKVGVTPAVMSLQINMHRLLPKKYLDKFCKILGISKAALIESMEGGSNE